MSPTATIILIAIAGLVGLVVGFIARSGPDRWEDDDR